MKLLAICFKYLKLSIFYKYRSLFLLYPRSGGKLVDASPEIERELKQELEKLAKAYGGDGGADMTAFPSFKFEEPKLGPINSSSS